MFRRISRIIVYKGMLALVSIGIVFLGILGFRILPAFASNSFYQQGVEAFLYPPYPGSVAENSIFDHDAPTYNVNGHVIAWNGVNSSSLSYDGHPGIDYDTEFVPIFAAAYSNQVDYAGWDNPADHRGLNLGLFIQLHHPENGYKTIYGHLSALALRACTTPGCADVVQGSVIGISGNTGNSTGPHLHFEVLNSSGERVDPYGWSGDYDDPWTPNQPNSLWKVVPDLSGVENENSTVLPLGAGNALPFPGGPVGGIIVDDNANGNSPDFSTVEPEGGCWSASDLKPDAWAENGRNLSHSEAISTNPDNPANPTCTAKWQLPLSQPSGEYTIYVRVPRLSAITGDNVPIDGAVYRIYAGETFYGDVIVNQYQINEFVLMADGASDDATVESGWIYIGNYNFEQGEENYVELTNLQYGPSLYRDVISWDPYQEIWRTATSPIILADAVRFVPATPSGNVDIGLIIDSSGSMSWNDPGNKRLEASRNYVSGASYPGDFIAVVDFDSAARIASPLQRIPEFQESLITAINTINSSGGTNIGVGVQAGCDLLNQSIHPPYSKGAILLTDGDGSFSGQDQCFIANGWPIYAFGFGDANDTLLQQIAFNTGGEYKRVDNLSSLTCEFSRVRSLIAGITPLTCIPQNVPYLASITLPVTVPPGQAQATFSTSWPGSDVVMTLTAPSGRVIDRDTVAADVDHNLGSTYEIYRITDPEPGNWQVSLYGADVPPEGEEAIFGLVTVPAPNPPQPNVCTPSNAYGQSGSGYHLASLNSAPLLANFERLPLSFIPNRGQEDGAVKFNAKSLGGNLFFTPGEVVFSLPNPVKIKEKEDEKEKIRYDLHPANVVRIHYQGANENPEVVPIGQLSGVVNVLKGNNSSKWRTNLPTYSGIAYRELYTGVELRYEGTDGNLKSTFHVAPGADPSAIVWRYKGVDSLSTDDAGNLVVNLPEPAGNGAVMIEQAPIAWQVVNDNRVMVAVQYAVEKNDKKVSFTFPNGYDSTLPLVIDPTITYSAYLGGGKTDEAYGITVDGECNLYVTGATSSSNFPTVNPFQTNPPTKDIFISKLNPAGDTLLYSTYLGGDESDQAAGVLLDSQGRITIVGESESSDFPIQNGYASSRAAGTCGDGEPCDDVVVAQLSADGAALRYSTYLGGGQEDDGLAMAIGPDDKIYITGATRSSGFPTVNAYDNTFGGGTCSGDPCNDVFVAAINPALTGTASLLYSTFLGGNNYDVGTGIAVDSAGHVYVSGYARSSGFPSLNAYQSSRAGSVDAFVTKLDPSLSGTASLLYSTYLGGTEDDRGFGLALHGTNQVYLTGYSRSPNFPRANAFDDLLAGTCGTNFCYDAFVSHLDIGSNTLAFSSFLGGSNDEEGAGITVDNNGNIFLTGHTISTDFQTLAAIQPQKGADSCASPPCADAFVTKVSAAGTLIYSTYLGGSWEDYGNAILVDGLGNTYIAGYTFSSDLPNPNTFPYVGGSGYSDAFVVKIED